MSATKHQARVAGSLCLGFFIAPIGLLNVPGRLIVSGSATATFLSVFDRPQRDTLVAPKTESASPGCFTPQSSLSYCWVPSPPARPPGRDMHPPTLLKHPSAFLPVAMSLMALATVLIFIALHGTSPQADEGAAARLWQLLMAAQAPIVLTFAIKWVPRSPRQAVPILALQAGAALGAMAPVFLLHW